MRPPICEVCDVDVDPSTDDASVTFVEDAAAREWARRAESEPRVGHPPNVGWFCPEHVAAARRLARTETLGDALAAIGATDPTVSPTELETGAGRIVHGELAGRSWIEWDVTPVDAAHMAEELRLAAGELCSAIGVEPPQEWDERTTRSWTPMDGVGPPDCPFDDLSTREGTGRAADGERVRVAIELDVVHWDEERVNSATADLTIGGSWPDEPGRPPLIGVSTFGATGAGRSVHTLRLRGRRRESVVGVVDRLVQRLERPV